MSISEKWVLLDSWNVNVKSSPRFCLICMKRLWFANEVCIKEWWRQERKGGNGKERTWFLVDVRKPFTMSLILSLPSFSLAFQKPFSSSETLLIVSNPSSSIICTWGKLINNNTNKRKHTRQFVPVSILSLSPFHFSLSHSHLLSCCEFNNIRSTPIHKYKTVGRRRFTLPFQSFSSFKSKLELSWFIPFSFWPSLSLSLSLFPSL